MKFQKQDTVGKSGSIDQLGAPLRPSCWGAHLEERNSDSRCEVTSWGLRGTCMNSILHHQKFSTIGVGRSWYGLGSASSHRVTMLDPVSTWTKQLDFVHWPLQTVSWLEGRHQRFSAEPSRKLTFTVKAGGRYVSQYIILPPTEMQLLEED